MAFQWKIQKLTISYMLATMQWIVSLAMNLHPCSLPFTRAIGTPSHQSSHVWVLSLAHLSLFLDGADVHLSDAVHYSDPRFISISCSSPTLPFIGTSTAIGSHFVGEVLFTTCVYRKAQCFLEHILPPKCAFLAQNAISHDKYPNWVRFRFLFS